MGSSPTLFPAYLLVIALGTRLGSGPVAVTQTSDIALFSSKEFLGIQETIECGFTLNCILDMIRTYNQNYFLYHQSWSSTFKVQLEVIRYPGPVSLDFLRSLCLWKKNLKYGRSMISSWRNRFTFLGGIRLHWQFHTGFREILKVAWFK